MQKRAWSLTVVMTGLLMGCSEPLIQQSEATEEEVVILPQGSWQVEALDQTEVSGSRPLTLVFSEDDRVSGFTGCNRFTGKVTINADSLVFTNIVSTRRGCPVEIGSQEQRFFSAINETVRYKLKADKKLKLYDSDGLLRMKFSKAAEKVAVEDPNRISTYQYQCDSLGEVTLAQQTAETVKLMVGHSSDVLQRSPTASGVQYVNTEMSFWQKGQQAMFTHHGLQHRCTMINA